MYEEKVYILLIYYINCNMGMLKMNDEKTSKKDDEQEGRKRICITIDPELYEVLKKTQNDLELEDGSKYPFSYLIEDMLWWVVLTENYERFLKENYNLIEYPEEDTGEVEDEEDHST